MPEDAQIAESSAAVVEEQPNDGTQQGTQVNTLMDSWTPAQQAKFMETGEMPPAKPSKGQPSAPDAKTAGDAKASEADTKPSADPVAAIKAENQARYKEILADRAQARQEAAQLRQKIAELEQRSPVKPEPPAREVIGKPEFPKRSDYQVLDDYEKAMVDYSEALTDWKIQESREADRQKSETDKRAADNAELLAGWESRLADAIEGSEDGKGFEEAIAQAAEVLKDHPGISRFIMKSPYGPQMAAKLGNDPKALRALVRISDGADLADALADLKNEVRNGAAKPASDPASGLPVVAKPVSKASAPPAQLSTAAAAPTDEVQAAIASGDVAKYMEVMNARQLKAMRG